MIDIDQKLESPFCVGQKKEKHYHGHGISRSAKSKPATGLAFYLFDERCLQEFITSPFDLALAV